MFFFLISSVSVYIQQTKLNRVLVESYLHDRASDCVFKECFSYRHS